MGFNGKLFAVAHNKMDQALIGFIGMQKFPCRCETAFGFEQEQEALGVVFAFFLGSPVNIIRGEFESFSRSVTSGPCRAL